MDGYEFEQDEDRETLLGLRKMVKGLNQKVSVLCDIVSRYEKELDHINLQLHKAQTKHMRSEICVSNLVENDDENLEEACQQFLAIDLELGEGTVKLSEVFRKGDKGLVVMHLENAEQKKLIFGNATKLKDKTNRNGKKYGVSAHLPELEYEQDFRKRQIVQQNKALPKIQQHKIALKKGVLTVDGAKYQDRIQDFKASQIFGC